MVSRAMLVFDNAIKSEATRRTYHYNLRKFCEWTKISTPEGLLQLKTEFLQEITEDYLFHLKREGYATNTINSQISAIELFLVLNEKEIKFKKIRKMFPERQKLAGAGYYTNSEIKTMLEGESLRNKALIHILASSGMRVGALPLLRMEDLANLEYGCKKVIVYSGTKDEHITYINSECSKVLDAYLDKRRADGENITRTSPVVRTEYRVGVEPVKVMSLNAIKLVLFRMAGKIRGKSSGKYVRYQNAQGHSYRKRWITICKQADNANISLVEKMVGHSTTVALDNNYLKPQAEVLFREYCKHMNNLMIDQSQNIIQDQQEKIQSMSDEKDKRISQLEDAVRTIYEMLKEK